jgi:hypothetical protein
MRTGLFFETECNQRATQVTPLLSRLPDEQAGLPSFTFDSSEWGKIRHV